MPLCIVVYDVPKGLAQLQPLCLPAVQWFQWFTNMASASFAFCTQCTSCRITFPSRALFSVSVIRPALNEPGQAWFVFKSNLIYVASDSSLVDVILEDTLSDPLCQVTIASHRCRSCVFPWKSLYIRILVFWTTRFRVNIHSARNSFPVIITSMPVLTYSFGCKSEEMYVPQRSRVLQVHMQIPFRMKLMFGSLTMML